MKQPGKAVQRVQWVCFALYGTLMLCLLFGRSRYDGSVSYWEQVRQSVNLLPLRTVGLYLRLLTEYSDAHLPNLAVINLVGNVVMFIPLGFFFGARYPKLRALWRTLLATVLIICLVEAVQLFTLVGSCDVDDLILNTAGSGLGYGIFRILQKGSRI